MMSRLHRPPAHTPVNTSRPTLRATVPDSGSVGLAKSSPYDSFIRTPHRLTVEDTYGLRRFGTHAQEVHNPWLRDLSVAAYASGDWRRLGA